MNDFYTRNDVEKELDAYTQKRYSPTTTKTPTGTSEDSDKQAKNGLLLLFLLPFISGIPLILINVIPTGESKIAYLIKGIVAFVSAGLIIYGIVKALKNLSPTVAKKTEYQKRCSMRINATIVDLKLRDDIGDGDMYSEVLEYTYNGKTYTKTAGIATSAYNYNKIGQTKEIYINPYNPEESSYDEKVSNVASIILVIVLLFMTVPSIIPLLFEGFILLVLGIFG